MSEYYRDNGYHSRKQFLRRLKAALFIVLVLVLVGGGILAYDVYSSSKLSDTPSKSTQPINSTIASSTEIHNSPYFQFQTPSKWRSIANESKDGHYVYRQYNGPLVEQEFFIDVNSDASIVLPLVQTTRVQAISTTSSGTIKLEGGVSDHCKKAVSKATDHTAQIIKVNQVSFACNPDSNNFIVTIGIIGGGETISLRRVDGSNATYRMLYRNVTAQPNARDLDDMLRTFEAR